MSRGKDNTLHSKHKNRLLWEGTIRKPEKGLRNKNMNAEIKQFS